jgi:hypothetical protein
LKQFFFTNNGRHDDVLRTLINHSVFSMTLKKNVFQKDNCERIVEILQKLLYNTRPLGPLQPRQYYSTRSASSSHKISVSAVKAILTDFYCKILLHYFTSTTQFTGYSLSTHSESFHSTVFWTRFSSSLLMCSSVSNLPVVCWVFILIPGGDSHGSRAKP